MSVLLRVFLLVLPTVISALSPPLVLQNDGLKSNTFDDILVPVTLGVMSKCPDAILCENTFDQVLSKVMDKVELTLTYVGQLDDSEPDFGVKCMHGADECAGNVQQLCTAKYATQNEWWSFVHCQNFQGREQIGQPDIALKCAKVAGIDWENGPGKCAGLDGSGKGKEGVALLQKSVQHTAALGITKSCTILINGRQVCVHDGQWKECEAGHSPKDFIRQINHEYERINMNPSDE